MAETVADEVLRAKAIGTGDIRNPVGPVKIEIVWDGQSVKVNSPIWDMVIVFGLLETAKQVVADYIKDAQAKVAADKEKQATGPILGLH